MEKSEDQAERGAVGEGEEKKNGEDYRKVMKGNENKTKTSEGEGAEENKKEENEVEEKNERGGECDEEE